MNYALVTGGAGGIGFAVCREFAAHGFNIVCVDVKEDALEKAAEQLRSDYHVDVLAIQENLLDDNAPERILDKCKEYGAVVEILINNAGMGSGGPYHESDWKRQKALVDLDVIALMHMTRVFLPEMLQRGRGYIGNIGSNAGFMPLAPQPVYGAAKAFVISFSQALYEQYKHSGVSVTVICPSATKTNFFSDAGFDLKNLKGASPEEVAKTVYRAVIDRKAMVSHGFGTKVMFVTSRLLPRAVVRSLAAKIGASE